MATKKEIIGEILELRQENEDLRSGLREIRDDIDELLEKDEDEDDE
jgi:uncharacterized coiled-coil DUF342 family protein